MQRHYVQPRDQGIECWRKKAQNSISLSSFAATWGRKLDHTRKTGQKVTEREKEVGWNNINEKKITNIRHDLDEKWCNMYKGIRCNIKRQIRFESINIYWMRLSFCWLGENLLYPPPTWPLRFFTYLSPILREQFSI